MVLSFTQRLNFTNNLYKVYEFPKLLQGVQREIFLILINAESGVLSRKAEGHSSGVDQRYCTTIIEDTPEHMCPLLSLPAQAASCVVVDPAFGVGAANVISKASSPPKITRTGLLGIVIKIVGATIDETAVQSVPAYSTVRVQF